MQHIKDLKSVKQYFIMHNKCIILCDNNKRHTVKVQSKYFSNYPQLFIVISGKRYQINDKTFCFKYGVI